MRHPSIWLRLLVGGGIAISLALLLSVWGLAIVFGRHVEHVAADDLADRLGHLASLVKLGPDGGPVIERPPRDAFYQRPYSGDYWQVEIGGEVLRSRSLWDYDLPLPKPNGATTWQGNLPGPAGEMLLVLERHLKLVTPEGETPLRIAVATDRADLDLARRHFLTDLLPFTALLGGALIVGGMVAVAAGLRPLSSLSARVRMLNTEGARRIGADVPAEVLPLAREIDILLDARETELERARLRAGDLAHGLKTPLQALLGEAAHLREDGFGRGAHGIEEIVWAMQSHVDRELARARLAAESGSGSSDPVAVARSVVAVLQRTPRGQEIGFDVEGPPGLIVRVDGSEMTELLGALAENAARHARSRVAISATCADSRIVVCIRDDGPGVPDAMLETLADRGVRLDERPDSTGMGLAIAFDICRAVGGSLTLSNLAPGFLARVELPAQT